MTDAGELQGDRKLEHDLTELVAGLPSLPSGDRTSLRALIHRGEVGLALEELCACLARERLHISPAQYDKIDDLERMMELEGVAAAVQDLVRA
jgi:hypothetical protein